MNKFLLSLTLSTTLLAAPFVTAEEAESATPEVNSLEQLLQQVGQYQGAERAQNQRREREFQRNVANQQQLLKEAKAALAREQKRAEELKNTFDNNEKLLGEREEELRLQTGNLGEMFGVVRQVAGDLNVLLLDSLTSAEYPQRKADLGKLSSAKELPNINELEALWFTLQHEMTVNGKISQFQAPVLNAQGVLETQEVTRVGVFNALSSAGYLTYDAAENELQQLVREPSAHKLALSYQKSTEPAAVLAVDPSRGALLSMSLETPDLLERIQQGALVGYIIMIIGAIGLAIAGWRLVVLEGVAKRVRQQKQRIATPTDDNPLGRVLLSYQDIPKPVNVDVLEAKMDEAVLRELPQLEIGQTIIKLFAGIAPLLGLLGTVTGMIVTFQAITNFGTGDPKLMAGGISQALVTTVQGLVVAIPLLLAHNWVSSRSKAIMQLLDEQAAGLIAEGLEQSDKAN